MSPQNEKLDAALFRGRSEKFGTLLRTEESSNLLFVELRAPHRGIFPFTRKDTKGVSKGTPLRYPWGLCPRSNRKRSRAPYVYHESLVHHWGNRRGTSPFCWKSKNQEVFGESLTTFFSQESSPGVQGRGATLQNEQVCRNLSLGQPTKHCSSPSQLSQRRIELVEILRGNDTKVCFRRICNIALLPYITPRPELMYS